jgi:hypothetical protein
MAATKLNIITLFRAPRQIEKFYCSFSTTGSFVTYMLRYAVFPITTADLELLDSDIIIQNENSQMYVLTIIMKNNSSVCGIMMCPTKYGEYVTYTHETRVFKNFEALIAKHATYKL